MGNSIYKNLIYMFSIRPDILGIKISILDYIDLLADDEARKLLDLPTNLQDVNSGHFANLFGKDIYVDDDIPPGLIEVSLKSHIKWSMPIKFSQLSDIDRLLKLKVFY